MDIQNILKQKFGYNEFRGQQEEIIRTAIDKKDALVIMPTGGGKSLCFQIPALVQDGFVVVVSPLIALMNDQVAALQLLDIEAHALHSNLDAFETQKVYEKIDQGTIKLLYVSPEKLLSPGFISYLKEKTISLFAIDEAHCVSVWGNDFRPEYVKLSILKKEFSKVSVMALTATADPATQKDIIEQLQLDVKEPFLASFERTNIHINGQPGTKRLEQIVQFVGNRPKQAGIIYCLSRKSTEKVALKLCSLGYLASSYHAGMTPDRRRTVQTQFQNDDIHIVCATIAFGMGIDKPNIRYVVHYNMPKNLEGFYQEIGRAGRDGQPAESLLFASWGDMINLRKFIEDSPSSDTFKQVQMEKLDRMWQFASDTHCRTNFILNYFGEFKEQGCGHCDNCLHPPQYFDGTVYTQMALSAVMRTDQKCNLQSLVDILKGTFSPEVKSNNWQLVKTFGVGRKLTFNEWKDYITQIINKGLLQLDYSDRSRLKITPLSSAVLKGENKIDLAQYIPVQKKSKLKAAKLIIADEDVDEGLLGQLRQWRSQTASAAKVPAYVVLHDKALRQLSATRPKELNDLLNVDGIGPKKLERYGEEIMEIIQTAIN